MKTKPKRFDYLALFLAGIGVAMPLQIMLLYGHTPLEASAITAKLAPLNWMILLAAPLTAWLVYRASPWALGAVPMLTAIVIQNNWFVAEMSLNYSPVLVGTSTGLFVLAMGAIFTRDMRELLLNPNRRWWLTPRRKRAQLPIHIVVPGHGEYSFDSNTYDISETGAFILPIPTKSVNEIPEGTNCSLCIDLDRDAAIRCEAEVVRTTTGGGNYPAGIGLRFVRLGSRDKKTLHSLVNAA